MRCDGDDDVDKGVKKKNVIQYQITNCVCWCEKQHAITRAPGQFKDDLGAVHWCSVGSNVGSQRVFSGFSAQCSASNALHSG